MIKISEELLGRIVGAMANAPADYGQELYDRVRTVWLSKNEEDTVHLRLNLMNDGLKRIGTKHNNDVERIDKRIDDLSEYVTLYIKRGYCEKD